EGDFLFPVWAAEGLPGRPLGNAVVRRLSTEIQFDEDLLHRDADTINKEFFQINSEWGLTWQSRSLGDFQMPFDATHFTGLQFYDVVADDITLPWGRVVRRVSFKAPLARLRSEPNPRPFRPNPGSPNSQGQTSPPPRQPIERPFAPWIV